MDNKVLEKITYGLYLLSVREGERDNGCIINTAVQVANNPTRISISVSKDNLTHDMLLKTGVCNLSAISVDADFSLFERFGMQSGRTADKFADFSWVSRSENGLLYLTKYANSFTSLKICETHDLGSHTLFVGELVDGEVLSDVGSCSYGFYHSDIKPKPQTVEEQGKGWRCKICGYVYEGETLPDDFVCPLCKHGPEDFEKI